MSIFAAGLNVFRLATSKFTKEKKSWPTTWAKLKSLPFKEHPIRSYRRFREYRIAERLKPFWKKAPGWTSPTKSTIVPTQVRLQDKFQYLFQVFTKDKLSGLIEEDTFSFLSAFEMTKAAAEIQMIREIDFKQPSGTSPEFEVMDLTLIEVRQQTWMV